MVWPEKIAGTIDMTIENLMSPASTDQNSLKFGRLPDFKIKKAAIKEGSTASSGFIDIIVCTFA
jgi:hypothetical protein